MNKLLLTLSLLLLLFIRAEIATAQPAASEPTTSVSTERAHSVLNKVLQRGEFRTYSEKNFQQDNNAWKRWWQRHAEDFQRMMLKFQRWLNRFLPNMPQINADQISKVGLWVRYIIMGILLAIVLLLLSFLLKHMLLRKEQRKFRESSGADNKSLRTHKMEPNGWEKALLEAEEFWRAGMQREALHTLQLACLTLLDVRGILRYDETRANGEVLRELRRHGYQVLRSDLAPIVRNFDKCWYGLLPISEEEFTFTLAQSRRFRDQMMGGQDA